MNENNTGNGEIRDLGFGSVVSQESRQRLLNQDGTFNVERTGLRFWQTLSLYHALLTMSWTRFFGTVALTYLGVNLLFACGYWLCGPDELVGPTTGVLRYSFPKSFFFSVQTFSTIGYGQIAPAGLLSNLLVTVESLVGLLGVALATGVLFARFSRPDVKILYSRNALIAPYRGGTAFMFRIANARSSQVIEMEAKVLFSRFEDEGGRRVRRFQPLTLERNKVVFFPLSWTVVHPIAEGSPLLGLNSEDFRRADAEFLILLTGIEETFSQQVHSRTSYKADEIVWNAKFRDMFNRPDDRGTLSVDICKLNEFDRLDP